MDHKTKQQTYYRKYTNFMNTRGKAKDRAKSRVRKKGKK